MSNLIEPPALREVQQPQDGGCGFLESLDNGLLGMMEDFRKVQPEFIGGKAAADHLPQADIKQDGKEGGFIEFGAVAALDGQTDKNKSRRDAFAAADRMFDDRVNGNLEDIRNLDKYTRLRPVQAA